MKDTPKDIINVLIPPKVEDEEDDEESEMPETEYKEKHVPEHPYCTNWPVSKKEKDENI
jgi:hypothetical protein